MGNYLQSGTIDIKMRILPLKLRKMHILKNFIKSCRLRKENFPLKYNRNRPERQKTINDKVRSIIGIFLPIILLTLPFILLIMQIMHILKKFQKNCRLRKKDCSFLSGGSFIHNKPYDCFYICGANRLRYTTSSNSWNTLKMTSIWLPVASR